jgi:hypothetical protein
MCRRREMRLEREVRRCGNRKGERHPFRGDGLSHCIVRIAIVDSSSLCSGSVDLMECSALGRGKWSTRRREGGSETLFAPHFLRVTTRPKSIPYHQYSSSHSVGIIDLIRRYGLSRPEKSQSGRWLRQVDVRCFRSGWINAREGNPMLRRSGYARDTISIPDSD